MVESNRLIDVECDCFNALLGYSAQSPAGVAHKLAAVLDKWRVTKRKEDPDQHEEAAMLLMVDAERALYDLLPAERPPANGLGRA